MEVSCPQCRARLLLPAEVSGRPVCCPTCRAVLQAESGRLVPTAGAATEITTEPPPAASSPSPRAVGAVELPSHADDAQELDIRAPGLPIAGRVARLHRVPIGARGLRVTATALSVWLLLNLSCAAIDPEPTALRLEDTLPWPAWVVALIVLMVGGYQLHTLDHRGWALAGSAAALFVALGFAFAFFLGLLHTAHPPPLRGDVHFWPVYLIRALAAFVVSVCGFYGAFTSWRAASDPDVRRAFRQ
jgi:hypothetical protein